MYHSFRIYGCQTMLDKRVIIRGFIKKSIYDISRRNFLFSLWNICCRYSLEAPRCGASNEYPQHMFYVEIKQNIPKWSPNTFFNKSSNILDDVFWLFFVILLEQNCIVINWIILVRHMCLMQNMNLKLNILYKIELRLHSIGKFSRREIDIFFFNFFPEKRIWHFMRIVSLGYSFARNAKS